jgi:hypothetical protein
LLLLYVSGQYWQMYAAQRTLAQEWQLQSATSHPVDVFMRGVGYALVAKTRNTLIYGQSA